MDPLKKHAMVTIFQMLRDAVNMEGVLDPFATHHANVIQDGQVKTAVMKLCQLRLSHNHTLNMHLVLSQIDLQPKFN